MTDNLIDKIKLEIKRGLPGEESQLKMTPYRRLTTTIPEDRRRGAVLLLLYQKENEWYFPLIQRNAYEGVHSRQISFPGGKIEVGETPIITAVRETHEEIGVLPTDVEHISPLTGLYIPPSNFEVHPFMGFTNSLPNFIPDPREVDEIIEVSLRELLNDENERETLVETKYKMKLKTPYFHLNERVVWGATAAILSEFKDVIKNIVH